MGQKDNAVNYKRIDYIDTLRFIAVVFIVFTHFDEQCFYEIFNTSVATTVFSPPSPFHWYFYGITGKYALAMMCVVSGFIVAWKCNAKKIDMTKYIIQRYVRMMLPCLFITGIIFVLGILMKTPYSLGTTVASAILPGVDSLNPHLWCIDEIFMGGLISAVYIICYKEKKWFYIGFVPIVIGLFVSGQLWIAACILGAAAYYLGEWVKEHGIMKWYVAAVLLLGVWVLRRDVAADKSSILYGRYIIGATIAFVVIYTTPVLQRILSWSKFRTVKNISYSLFVVHYATYGVALKLFEVLQNQGMENVWLIYVIAFGIKSVCDIILSLIVYYLGEKKIPECFKTWGMI